MSGITYLKYSFGIDCQINLKFTKDQNFQYLLVSIWNFNRVNLTY